MNPQDPLAQLRDIHLPEAVGWWPPAPGWWLLTLLVLLASYYLVRFLVRNYRNNCYRREALACLETMAQQPEESLTDQCHALLMLLRRTAKTAYPGFGLESERVPDMLDRMNHACRKPVFDESLQQILGDQLYRADANLPPSCLIQLAEGTRRWIKQHRRGASC